MKTRFEIKLSIAADFFSYRSLFISISGEVTASRDPQEFGAGIAGRDHRWSHRKGPQEEANRS